MERSHQTKRQVAGLLASPPSRIQRCGGMACPSGTCVHDEDSRSRTLFRSPASTERPRAVPSIVNEVVSSAGAPLDGGLRSYFEPRFGHNFGHVRVHAGLRAAESASAVNARAYTVGRHVVLGEGITHDGTGSDRRLFAHELAHVVQQDGYDEPPTEVGPSNDAFESQADGVAARLEEPLDPGQHEPSTRRPTAVQRLGANPGCSMPQRTQIHQGIFDARGWLNKAIPNLEARPLSTAAIASLRRNFGPTYGTAADAGLIAGRLRTAVHEISTIPFGCSAVGDVTCGVASPPCGYTPAAGGHSAVICTAPTLAAGVDPVYRAGCVLHESFHAAFSRFTIDHYSGWRGHSGSSLPFPGPGTDPLLNADSYTSLVIDLS